MKENDAQQHRANGPNACPHGISRAYGQSLHRLGQQHHAQDKTHKKTDAPQIPLRAGGFLHLAKTEGKARLKKTGNNKNNPIHLLLFFSAYTKSQTKIRILI